MMITAIEQLRAAAHGALPDSKRLPPGAREGAPRLSPALRRRRAALAPLATTSATVQAQTQQLVDQGPTLAVEGVVGLGNGVWCAVHLRDLAEHLRDALTVRARRGPVAVAPDEEPLEDLICHGAANRSTPGTYRQCISQVL